MNHLLFDEGASGLHCCFSKGGYVTYHIVEKNVTLAFGTFIRCLASIDFAEISGISALQRYTPRVHLLLSFACICSDVPSFAPSSATDAMMHNPLSGSCGQLEEPVLTENPKKNELWFFWGGFVVLMSIYTTTQQYYNYSIR